MRGTLRGDYKNFGLEFSVVDFTASEVRMDKSQHLVASQLKREIISLDATVDQKMHEQDLLLFFTFTKNPINNPGVNKELRMVLRPLEINMNLDCQWIGHLKGFMREVTTAPNVEKFWGELSLAYLNSLTLGKLALMAKAESAASGHENLDVDVAMHCPVLRIGIGDDADLLIDLGILSLRTDRLAGISRNKLKKRPLIQNGSAEDDFAPLGLRQMSIDDGSLNGGSRSSRVPSSVFRKPIRNLMFSSAVSLESIHASERTNRSFDGSLNLDDAFPAIDRGSERKNSQNESRIEELFYDKYQLRLQTGKISFSGESEVFDVSSGFELRTTIQKSIIPTDHTLCKLKAHTVVESIKLVLNEDLVSRFAVGYTMWKSLMKADVASQTYRRAVTKSLVSKDEVGRFIPNDDQVKHEYDSSSSETASEIDECEFFDAKEGAESVGGENTSGVWFEDHWIADAESVIDAGSRGSSNDRRFHRRQPSLSDVSSVSDHSKNRRSQLENGYLSAENLARLEEVGEDDSVAESGKEMDDDSFHSVMSAGGQAQLLTDLEESAKELEAKIEHLSAIMEENADTLVDINDPELPERRNIHKKTKRDIHRSKAELKALNAVCQDLQILLSDKGNNLAPELDKEEFAVVTIQQARTAKALIHAKQRNDSDESHRLVRHLNRELFKGSILLSELQITLRTGDHSSDVKHDGKISDFEFFASQVALALFHYANDTKIYFSLDQVAMSVTNVVDVHAVKPSLIFSGGSSDTPLPVRLPHLVAHSMEDRFIRGVMAIRKHRSSESSRRLAKSCKIRLVVGDVEMSPSHKSITLMLQSLVRVKAAMTSSESCIQTRDTPEPEDKQTEQLQRSHHYFDLALRLTSVRIVLTHEDKVTGAVVASESSLRLLLLASQIRNKFQGDFRCANAQLLDILSFENIETCRGSEILGRRDPYNFLFQLRLRSQLVPSDERSGWVVGVHTPDSDNKRGTCDVRNTHLGIKISPLSILASPDAFTKLSKSLCEIRQVFQKPRDLSKNQKKVSFIERIARQARLRWRFDLVLRRINIRFPDENKSEWNISDDIGTKMVVAFTTVLSVQESNIESGRISIRMGVTDISMIRSMDDWPILEPFTMIFELTLMSNFVSRLSEESRVDILPLLVMAGSPLNEIDVIMTRYGWGSIPSRECNDEKSTLVLKFSPLKINISVCIIAFINGILQSFKTNPSRKQEKKLEPNPTMSLLPSAKNMMGRNKFGLQVSFEDAEIQLLRANESKPIAYASRLISFTMTDVTVDYSQGEEVSASILIRDSALFDLSSGKGIRVIGEDPEARLGFPYFVRIKLYMHLEGVQTIRLHINWGKIQCLVLPSFFRSILDLKEGLKSLNGTNRASGETRGRKVNPYIRFLHHPNDINLILSADAETFECILASRDIIEYVKNGDKDPFGVVTFRWKASLSLAMALDCLKDSSVPWLTLNFDGIFTDEEDVDLFKDFSNNYLGNSSGLPVENVGYKLANAFSTKVNYKLSAFQVLRTNITLMELFNPSQKGFTVMPRICFKISQPIAGEQRITNPIDLVLVYKATGASIANRADDEFSEYEVKLAQLLLLEANFVDVLVYMGSKRLGGFSDSFSVSVKPILDMAKRKDTKRISQDNGISVPTDISSRFLKTPKLSDILKSSPSICRVQIEGFLVTCVPGGASRLNESPIIKFELSNILSGIAAVPVNLNLGMVPGKGTSEEDNSQRQYIAGSEMMNANVGGWIAFQITGHYHNRRLVAWEPFIEPWIADISFGIDLVEACRWEPTIKQEATITRTATESSLTEVSGVETPGTGKDRLREIGRLIRSPFQSLQSSTSSRKGSPDISHSDLCYLMLSSSARSILSSALYNSSGSQSDVESKIFNTMPSTSPIEWLQGFGKPTKTSSTRDDHGPFSISVILSDKMPLNVNLTGALIENVMGYLDNTKKTGSKAIVPHVIRNASGMTLRFREVLGTDRTKRKEKSAKIILADGSETPLTLKRSLSQTCDPHRAFIYLELGSFEDTVGRISNGDFAIPKGERSANFSFKASAKIPVDAVGVHRYPLDRNVNSRGDTNDDGSNSRALGWIIVRVALRGSVKVVSIESPFVLKNAADADLLCEVRDESGISLLWRCLVPKEECTDSNWKQDGVVSIPADIVPFIHDGSYRFSVTAISRSASFLHEADLTAIQYNAVEISTPPPFSPKSFGRGLVGEEEVILPALVSLGNNHSEGNEIFESDEKVHVTACAMVITLADIQDGVLLSMFQPATTETEA
ncbi:unnamed protein product [Pseudo-nitzschia multistriata]|uniref:Uncharacterized protein n=1 Tax=Pseudo-nitzschia multistriata TaxID=183589 RepID=A0A448Z1W7_9STRA|nr:unnamed protein product [Pseudo-nitzschia multistriata]